MQRAPSATSPIGPIASTSTSTASLLGNHVVSGPTDPRGSGEDPRGPDPTDRHQFHKQEVPKTIQYIQKQTTAACHVNRRHILSKIMSFHELRERGPGFPGTRSVAKRGKAPPSTNGYTAQIGVRGTSGAFVI